MNGIIIGCGYVGTAVAKRWKQQGITVTATTTHAVRLSELEPIADRAIVLNSTDQAALQSALIDQQIVLLSVGAPNAEAYKETYLHTAKTLVKVLEQSPAVQQVIYTGSYAVYGDQQGNWVIEETPVKPANCNGEILVATEQVLLTAANSNLKVCLLRLGGIYGPGRELEKIFRRAAGTTRPGNGSEPSNWVHLDDIVGAIEFAHQHQLNGIYNLVQTVPLTTGELLARVCAAHNLASVQWDASQSSTRPYNARVSNEKLRAAGYQFVYPEIKI
ncbi:MAG: SDR family oxidoreductase [Elainellaceae cyanobacterium]